jgi:ankyrin repeat protein
LQQEADELWRILLAATSDAAACNTICVLDALDECRNEDRGDLIAKLARFHECTTTQGPRQSWLKFVVTSRPYDDIQTGFQQIPTSLPVIRLQGEHENDQIHEEINRVIHVRVSQLADELDLRESTSARLEQNLLAMEHRTYLWLHLAIDDIRMTLRDSFRPDEESIESVPSSVETAYEKILTRVTQAQHQKVKLILQIIVGARRPLALSEMALALGLATSKQHRTSTNAQIDPIHLGKQLRHWCGLFVFVNQSRIYLIHQTAREFLVARQEHEQGTSIAHSTWRHCVQQAEMEQVMTSICIRCLNLKDREVSPNEKLSTDNELSTEGVLPASDESPTDVPVAGGSNNEFIEYCCEWWTTHYKLCQDANEGDTLQEALTLYDTKGEAFKTWFDRFWAKTRRYDRAKSMTPIRLAALNNHSKVLKHFLDKTKEKTDAKDEAGRTALYWASDMGHDKVVEMLLERGADINALGGYYGNALQAASARGNDKVVEILLERSADINAHGGHYGSVLQAALARGLDKVVQMLLDRGADINAQGGQYGSALQTASARGLDKVVQVLLDKGADINAQGGQYGSALQTASARGLDKVVQMLLDKGADINAQGGEYGSALQAASAGGNDKVVQMLLDKGADINAHGGHYGNALQAASAGGHYKVLQALLDRGADVNALGGQYGSALHAASYGCHYGVAQLLLDRGAQINVSDSQGRTALHLAACGGSVEIFRYLAARGLDLKQLDNSGRNVLDYAAAGASLGMVSEVLRLDAGFKDESLWSPLHWACRKGNVALIRLLMNYGFEERPVEVCTISGTWTPHLIACLHQNEEFVSSSGDSINPSPLSLFVPPCLASLLYAQKHEGWLCDGCQQVRFQPTNQPTNQPTTLQD